MMHPEQKSAKHRGFTLLEMLVAVSVLLLLIALVGQLFNGATTSILSGQKRIDSDGAARTALGIMAGDFAGMVQRPGNDLEYLFTKAQGNDAFFFYSEAPGYISSANSAQKSGASLVGCRVNQGCLERLGQALTWSGSGGMLFLTGTVDPQNLISPPTASTNYHVVSEEVFRLEFCFMTRTGGYFEPSSAWKSWKDDDGDGVPNIRDVSAVVVAVACLDPASRKLVPDMDRLADALVDSNLKTKVEDALTASTAQDPAAELPAAIWQKDILSGAVARRSGAPQAAVAAVRVYQRIFYLRWN